MLNAIEKLAKIIQNLTIVFGIFASAITLLYAIHNKRVDRAMAIKSEYDSTYRKSDDDLTTKWNDLIEKDNGQKARDQSDEKQLEYMKSFFQSADNRHDLDDVLGFYDDVWICVKVGSCDNNTIKELFGDKSRDLWDTYGAYILDLRKRFKNPSIGMSVLMIARLKEEGLFEKLNFIRSI